jgi:hypothetical protein
VEIDPELVQASTDEARQLGLGTRAVFEAALRALPPWRHCHCVQAPYRQTKRPTRLPHRKQKNDRIRSQKE